MQLLLIRAKHYTVIHVSDIVFDPKLLFDVVVQPVQVEVGQPLAGEVSNRQAPVRTPDNRV